MSGADFLDSNIILYALDAEAPAAKRALAGDLVGKAIAHHSAVISWQVVQETLHVVTHRFKTKVSAADRTALLADVLVPLWKVQPSQAVYARSLAIQQRYGFAYYDSLIVAAALETGCKRLLTEDLQHGQRIDGLRVENPFRA